MYASWPTVPTTAPGDCGVDKLCVELKAPAQTEEYQLVTLWFQLDDDGPDPEPEIAYGARVPAGVARFEIPLSSFKAPTDEKNLLCERATDDEAASPCLSDPKVGYAVVVAVRDDGDGKFDFDDGSKDVPIGAVNAVIGYSAKAYAPGTFPNNAATWDRLWPKGIGQGVRIYQVERPDGSVFDRPVPSSAGIVNELGDKFPNLT